MEPLMLWATMAVTPGGYETPISDRSVSSKGRVLWAVLREAVARMDKRVEPASVLGVDDAEAMAAVHELVATGWLAVRPIEDGYWMAMVLVWRHSDIAMVREIQDEADHGS